MSMIFAKELRLLPLADVVKKSGPFESVDLLRSESLQTCIVPSQVHDHERVEFNTVLFKRVFHGLHLGPLRDKCDNLIPYERLPVTPHASLKFYEVFYGEVFGRCGV